MKKKSVVQSAAALVIFLLANGCTSLVLPAKCPDLGPFGDRTISQAGDVQHTLMDKKPLYIKPYLRQGTEVPEFRKQWEDMQAVLNGIALYASQVVALSRSSLEAEKKAPLLAQYLERMMQPLTDHAAPDAHPTRAELANARASVNAQKTLLAALGAAQPMVDEVERYSNEACIRLNEQLQRIVQSTQERIDANSAAILEAAAYLKSLQGRSVKSYALLVEHSMDNPQAFEALMENDPALRRHVRTENSVVTPNLDSMEKDILARLQNIAVLNEQLAPQLELYRAETRELDEYARSNEDAIQKARSAVRLWARTHANLAAGIVVQPADDVTDVLSGAATGAAKKALPVK